MISSRRITIPHRLGWLAACLVLTFSVLAAEPAASQGSLIETTAADAPSAAAQSAHITISRFDVEGNTLLGEAAVKSILAPFTGQDRGYGDIQRALEALEAAYHAHGYTAVQIYVPEQEIASGAVRLKVVEAVLGKVTYTGQQHHDENNLIASLPSLRPGQAPNARQISENIQLANQNPSKIVDVVLSVSDKEGEVDAKVMVADDNPGKFLFSADNTGNDKTGHYRAGVGYRDANLFNRDHEIALNFSTSPDHVKEVQQFSVSYRLPLYGLGDSIDFIAAKSDTATGTSPLVGGASLTFSGSGDVYGLHYNHNFTRRGEYASRLVAGLDWRAYNNDCSLLFNGTQAGCGSSGADVTVHPLSFTYAGEQTSPGQQISFNFSYAHNLPGGNHGNDRDFAASRPNTATGIDGAGASYQLVRLGLDYLKILPANWQAHFAINGQYTRDALVSGEQFGLAGATAVRGFQEREEARDRGYLVNAELYTPDLAGTLGLKQSSLRGLVFLDHARGEQVKLPGETNDGQVSLASVGLGLRYALGRDISARFDVGRVIDAAGHQQQGDWRGHFSFNMAL